MFFTSASVAVAIKSNVVFFKKIFYRCAQQLCAAILSPPLFRFSLIFRAHAHICCIVKCGIPIFDALNISECKYDQKLFFFFCHQFSRENFVEQFEILKNHVKQRFVAVMCCLARCMHGERERKSIYRFAKTLCNSCHGIEFWNFNQI